MPRKIFFPEFSHSIEKCRYGITKKSCWVPPKKYLHTNQTAKNTQNKYKSISVELCNFFFIYRILQGERTTWEYHTVILYRVAGYGFGIAVVSSHFHILLCNEIHTHTHKLSFYHFYYISWLNIVWRTRQSTFCKRWSIHCR